MSENKQAQKPDLREWVQAAEVLSERLAECVHAYKHNTYIFMAHAERQHKSGMAIKFLHRIHALLDKAENVPANEADVQKHDDHVVAGFRDLFRDALKELPGISADMQKLLNSAWMKGFPDKIAEALFWGKGEEARGIGSGNPENGRLPGVLASLIEREEMGETRPSRDPSDMPQRHDESDQSRWHTQNAGYLRRAGRMD